MLCFGVWWGEAATVLSSNHHVWRCKHWQKVPFQAFTDHVPLPGLIQVGATRC